MVTKAEARLRSRDYWEKRRARGQCCVTGCHQEPAINPKTGLYFWRCEACRRGEVAHLKPRKHGAARARRATCTQ